MFEKNLRATTLRFFSAWEELEEKNMTVRLEQQRDGTYKKVAPKRKYPEMIESIVDTSNFRPNVNDARSLLSSEKIGNSGVKLLYDFEDGRDNGPNHSWMRNRPDITEVDAKINQMQQDTDKMLKKASEKARKVAEQNMQEIAEIKQTTVQNTSSSESTR